MSLRTSAHTGVAIRFPRRETWQLGTTSGKFVVAAYSPKVLLSAMYCRRGCGLPRRFAPRNDKGEGRPCTRAHVLPSACHCEPVQNGNRGAPVRPGEGDAAERLRPGFSSGKAGAKDAQLVSPRCGNPHPRRNAWQVGSCSGKLVTPYVFAQSIVFHFVLLHGEADCPVAPLLAMTCNNLLRARAARTHYRNKSAPLHPRKPLPRRENTFPPGGKFVNLGEDFFRWVCYNDGQWEKFPF